MASYTWPDGSRGHTIPWAEHKARMDAAEEARRNAAEGAIKQAAANRERQGGPPAGPAPLNTNPLGDPMKGSPVGAATEPAPEAPPPPRRPFEYVRDSAFDEDMAVHKARYDEAIRNLDADERTTKFSYGFDDPTNPNSRVSEMKRLFLAKGKSNQINLNNAGLLYSGANLRAIARNKRDEDASTAQLRAAYEAALEAIRRGRVSAKSAQEDADRQSFNESYQRQLAAYNAS